MGEGDDLEVGQLAEHGEIVDLEETQVDVLQLAHVVRLEFVLTDDHITREWVLTLYDVLVVIGTALD